MCVRRTKIMIIGLVLFLSCNTASYASLDNATRWLAQQQDLTTGAFHSDGWSDGSIVLTLKALDALQHTALEQNTIDKALTYLNQFSSYELDTDLLAQRIILNDRYRRTNQHDITQLLHRKNTNGSFGSNFTNDTPNVISTASALMAFKKLKMAVPQASVQYLMSQQTPSGQWRETESSEEITFFKTIQIVDVINANQQQFTLGKTLSKARRYLSENVSNENIEVSVIVPALTELIRDDQSIENYQNLIDSLTKTQQANGSFDNDVYLTAVMVQLLNTLNQLSPTT